MMFAFRRNVLTTYLVDAKGRSGQVLAATVAVFRRVNVGGVIGSSGAARAGHATQPAARSGPNQPHNRVVLRQMVGRQPAAATQWCKLIVTMGRWMVTERMAELHNAEHPS
jgi:hypothetical protein